MAKHLYILTGASRGMGLAMAEQLLAPHHQLLCISRHANLALASLANEKACLIEQWSCDLADAQPVASQLMHWLNALAPDSLKSATLINNAGMIPAIAPLSASNPLELARALRVGLEAPMLLSAAFLKATLALPTPRKVLNISSGLGRRPMASQAAYCAAKAGMDHFTRCLALDEARLANGAKVCSLAPGVIDTNMQTQLRGASPDTFPDQAGFAQLKQSGQLTSASDAAKRVLVWLQRPDFGQQAVADVRDAS
ncbi:MAG: SDR family NAD(P)-dependent oxidoreductase [Rhodoferax sp.]|uniref:SDR family NAD(P)-dependent oxidoreductase n=1 Tax=Rhodoferax sp. TaxID=50421 RepID=UPI00262C3FCA|nr:SDR family NAD(P)-dependent oxidoreductase [Rhodoferax sp.]MDD2883003.1 SDR family NAD(P)-dependent oxidoreductase [Rhodoferax sp.]